MISSCSKCDLQKGIILKGKEWIPESAPPGTGGSSRGDGGGARNRVGGERSGPQAGSRVAPGGCSAVSPASTTSTHACVHTHTHTHTQSLAREKGWSGFLSCRQERAHILASPRIVYPGESVPRTPAIPGTHLPPGSTPTTTSRSREG